ncbi:MAG: hypothetical protein KAJ01_04190 [Candidatus Hydrogenedentes bacterium]|nr:hypothetical protein [Candidatus Hydrogenedentota bacterium]
MVNYIQRWLHRSPSTTVLAHLIFLYSCIGCGLLGRYGRLARRKLFVSVWVIISFGGAGMSDAAPRVDVQVPARDPIIGRPFPLRIIVTWEGNADDYGFLPLRLPEKDDVTVTGSSISSSKSGETNRVEYLVHLTAAEKGEIEFGSVTIPYRVVGSDEEQSLQSDPVTFNVRGNPLPMRILMGAVSAGSAIGVVLLCRSIAVSRRERHEGQQRIDEHERARKSLKRLEELRSLRIAGDLGEYLVGLADIAAECGQVVRECAPFSELKELAEKTKFSGHHPSVEELDSSYKRVEGWVKRIAAQPAGETKATSATNG